MRTKTAVPGRVRGIVKAVAFTALFVLGFLYIAAVMQPATPEIIGMKGFYAEERNTLDAVYIGGSVCIVCWAPYVAWNQQGFTSYAFGVSTLASFSVLPLVRDALAYQSPKVLVIDLRPFQYTDPAETILKECSLTCASGMPLLSPNRYDVLRRGYEFANNLLREDTLLTFYFDISRYHGSWKSLTRDSFQYAVAGSRRQPYRGFMLFQSIVPIQLYNNTAVTDRLPVSALSEQNLTELLEYLKKINQKALFVVTTYSELETERKQYNHLADLIRAYGFDYLNANDYNGQMGMDPDNDYYNTAHTNIFGAEKYTGFIAAYLKEHYALPDHRGDVAYRDWAEGADVWVQTVSGIKTQIRQLKTQNSATPVPR